MKSNEEVLRRTNWNRNFFVIIEKQEKAWIGSTFSNPKCQLLQLISKNIND